MEVTVTLSIEQARALTQACGCCVPSGDARDKEHPFRQGQDRIAEALATTGQKCGTCGIELTAEEVHVEMCLGCQQLLQLRYKDQG